jgi:2-polyprenyl-6-methoxyphenol hydroxylase-like FAD-dependent oxidoreductase
MDVLAVTDFPDVRLKSAIQSANEGSALIIPREGGYLFRIYIELEKLSESARVSNLNLSAEKLVAAAQRIFAPYTLDVKEIVWWSAYEIGQRLTNAFDDATATRDPRVFIAGDACHTHSPKAGQGMNVSMQDAFNLGWKLAAVRRGQARPDLLRSYSQERHAVAKALIDFDREWAAMFSARPKSAEGSGGRRAAGISALFRPASSLHRRGRNALPALRALRTRDASDARSRIYHRAALSLGASGAARRRQARATGSLRAGGRALAALSVRRSRYAGIAPRPAMRVPRNLVAAAPYACGSGHRQRD